MLAPAQSLDRRRLQPPFRLEGGSCWLAPIEDLAGQCDTPGMPQASPLLLFEDGKPLGPGHTLHADIRSHGRGRYSAWGGDLYFSSSDNSDPNANGRSYVIAAVALDIHTERVKQFASALISDKSEHSTTYTRTDIDFLFASLLDRNHYKPCPLNDEKEYLLSKLIDELTVVQGGSVRTVCIADQYLQKALHHFGGSLCGRSVLEIGPGSNLGAGVVFLANGADRYYGLELYTDKSFNRASVLHSVQTLARLKYGSFLDNFNRLRLPFVPRIGALDESLDLADRGITLLKPQAFWKIPLPDASIDFVFSNFTFEHLQRIEETVAEVARVLKPGGATAHFIDLADHTDFSRPFEFLRYSSDQWEGRYREGNEHLYMNRYRASDYRHAFEAAGLRITNFEAVHSKKVTPAELAAFDAQFRSYDPDDLGVLWLMIEARR